MLGLIQNLNVVELVVIGVVAVLIFGRRLPEVASQAAHGLAKARRSLQDLRRQTGIDEELRQVRRTVEETEREARRAAAGWVEPVVQPMREVNAIARGAPWPADPAQPQDPGEKPVDPAENGGNRETPAPTSTETPRRDPEQV